MELSTEGSAIQDKKFTAASSSESSKTCTSVLVLH